MHRLKCRICVKIFASFFALRLRLQLLTISRSALSVSRCVPSTAGACQIRHARRLWRFWSKCPWRPRGLLSSASEVLHFMRRVPASHSHPTIYVACEASTSVLNAWFKKTLYSAGGSHDQRPIALQYPPSFHSWWSPQLADTVLASNDMTRGR